MKGSNENNKIPIIILALVIIFISLTISGCVEEMRNNAGNISSLFENENSEYDETAFNIISSTENKDLEDYIINYAKSEGIDVKIEYSGTIDIMDKLNSGEKYDAVWTSNSIWLYMLDSSKVKTSEAKSTSINPVIFAIKKSKAEELGFVGKDIYTKDIVSAIRDGKLKFSMSNPTQTNTGATAYLGLLSTLAGNPEVLKKENLENQALKDDMITLFSGLARSSGSDEFLEEMFLNGSYDSVITYESSIISLNKLLEEKGEEVLYALYPVDGVSISDSPFAFIDNGVETKKDEFLKIRNYILSSEGQKYLAQTGRRTWYGGINSNVDKTVFNPNWGINTTKYIVPLKFPSTEIIKAALSMYQSEFRKPVSIAFCLDYSGSMYGQGNKQLVEAMDYILNEDEAQNDLLQFTYKDKITVIPFSSYVMETWSTNTGSETKDLLTNIHKLSPDGGTNICDAAIVAIDQIENDDINTYNKSVVLMTDGQSNMGSYGNLERRYDLLSEEIPIYSIMFGDADKTQLDDIAELTNAKVFDGRTNLLEAFKEVRGYN
ncbi:MAG: VWA domain-containing protein [Clostridia bacterium]|nr:VWA domain-containing protein [Clostridia bacterium]